MTHRPYPNAARALRHIQYKRAVYQYGRCPQRYVMGIDPPPAPTVAPWPPKLPRVDGERLQAAMQEFSNIISRARKAGGATKPWGDKRG
ncbi:MAG: hypothetical protein JWO67_2251 [Streptosporangiaceae bacterium]|nr:hypothetical protein [Streptosporangiaceae bacterium]